MCSALGDQLDAAVALQGQWGMKNGTGRLVMEHRVRKAQRVGKDSVSAKATKGGNLPEGVLICGQLPSVGQRPAANDVVRVLDMDLEMAEGFLGFGQLSQPDSAVPTLLSGLHDLIAMKEAIEDSGECAEKTYCLLMVQVHLGQRLATSPTPTLTFREVTNWMKLREGRRRAIAQADRLSPEIYHRVGGRYCS